MRYAAAAAAAAAAYDDDDDDDDDDADVGVIKMMLRSPFIIKRCSRSAAIAAHVRVNAPTPRAQVTYKQRSKTLPRCRCH